MKKWALLLLLSLLTSSSLFAGYDQSILARLDGWEVQVYTAGAARKEGGQIVTRVYITGPEQNQSASLKLPAEAFGVLWHHLQKLPRQVKKSGASEGPKLSHIVLETDKDELITDARALDLIRLWLDSHRKSWLAPQSPDLQATLRAGYFPPKMGSKS